jgi:hypothetical protein
MPEPVEVPHDGPEHEHPIDKKAEAERIVRMQEERIAKEKERVEQRVKEVEQRSAFQKEEYGQEAIAAHERAEGREAWRQGQHQKRRQAELQQQRLEAEKRKHEEFVAKRAAQEADQKEMLDELYEKKRKQKVQEIREKAYEHEDYAKRHIDAKLERDKATIQRFAREKTAQIDREEKVELMRVQNDERHRITKAQEKHRDEKNRLLHAENAAGDRVESEMRLKRELAEAAQEAAERTLEVTMRYRHLREEVKKNETHELQTAERHAAERTARAEYVRAGELEDVGDPQRISEQDKRHARHEQEQKEHEEYLEREKKRRDQMK